MAIIIDKNQIKTLREAGRRLAFLVKEVSKIVAPGRSGLDLEKKAQEIIKELGDKSAFLNYKPSGAKKPYPAILCVSVNDAIVHGIPNDIVFREGDIVSIDSGLVHNGLFVDHAITVPVGKIDLKVSQMLEENKKALDRGIKASLIGNRVGDIGFAIQCVPDEFGLVRDLAGHGVGFAVHEDPLIPNYGKPGKGQLIEKGMVLAIEPMLTLGQEDIVDGDDGYTIFTVDGSMSSHFEHTIIVTEDGPEIITK